MDAKLSLDDTVDDRVELKKPSLLEDRERIISICNELLCSGQPLAEVLEEIKRLSDEPIRDIEPVSKVLVDNRGQSSDRFLNR